MKYGLYFINSEKKSDWLRESDKSIAIWDTESEADKWRRNHTVNPSKYTVKKVNKKVIDEDMESD
jgi:hypothetical protein